MSRNKGSAREQVHGSSYGLAEKLPQELRMTPRPRQETHYSQTLSIGRAAVGKSFHSLKGTAAELETSNPGIDIRISPKLLCTYLDMSTVNTILSARSVDFKTPEDILDFILDSATIDPESSRLPMTPELIEVKTRPKTKERFKVIARIEDEKSDFYPVGYRLTGERLEINELLGLKTDSVLTRTGSHFTTIPLASIAAPNFRDANEIAVLLAQTIVAPIELGPLELV
jgi:hypothetical protein